MTSIIFFFIFIPILSIILLSVNFIFAPHKPYKEKKTPFECGYHSFLSQNRTQFTISFFIFALLFLIFDLEIVLIYPYSVSGYSNNVYGLTVMIIFTLILTVGFIFELGKNALKIESKQNLSYRDKVVDTKVLLPLYSGFIFNEKLLKLFMFTLVILHASICLKGIFPILKQLLVHPLLLILLTVLYSVPLRILSNNLLNEKFVTTNYYKTMLFCLVFSLTFHFIGLSTVDSFTIISLGNILYDFFNSVYSDFINFPKINVKSLSFKNYMLGIRTLFSTIFSNNKFYIINSNITHDIPVNKTNIPFIYSETARGNEEKMSLGHILNAANEPSFVVEPLGMGTTNTAPAGLSNTPVASTNTTRPSASSPSDNIKYGHKTLDNGLSLPGHNLAA
jgi:NADH-ubiquinone oxidoreductase chain 3